MTLAHPRSRMLEASTSSWGFWQAKAEFPLQATKVVLGTVTLWRGPVHQPHRTVLPSASRSLLLASTSEVPGSRVGMGTLAASHLWYWFCRNWNSSLMRSKVSG